MTNDAPYPDESPCAKGEKGEDGMEPVMHLPFAKDAFTFAECAEITPMEWRETRLIGIYYLRSSCTLPTWI
jgi:hypothetical protein